MPLFVRNAPGVFSMQASKDASASVKGKGVSSVESINSRAGRVRRWKLSVQRVLAHLAAFVDPVLHYPSPNSPCEGSTGRRR